MSGFMLFKRTDLILVQEGKIMIRNIFVQALRLIADYPAEKAKNEAIEKQIEIREAEFRKRFYEKQSSIRKTRR